ncbi:hypothetical protein FA13DRAFT_1392572 [Coprinellus micaceus]|uniref:NACHT domain-containing protein n=1 Tax=Coprinellus micaceus TaxID=71717 RepID=A0A4Y7SQK1_COPMI|nr:hypothetical protein FA13DRAFT_1392572 [Coprinellus micaceus]
MQTARDHIDAGYNANPQGGSGPQATELSANPGFREPSGISLATIHAPPSPIPTYYTPNTRPFAPQESQHVHHVPSASQLPWVASQINHLLPTPVSTHNTPNTRPSAPRGFLHLLNPDPNPAQLTISHPPTDHTPRFPISTQSAPTTRPSTPRDYPQYLHPAASASQLRRAASGTSTPQTMIAASRTQSHPYAADSHRVAKSQTRHKRARSERDPPQPHVIQAPYVNFPEAYPSTNSPAAHNTFMTPRDMFESSPSLSSRSSASAPSSPRSQIPPWLNQHPAAPCPEAHSFVGNSQAVSGTSYFPHSRDVTVRNLITNSGPPKSVFEHLFPHICHEAAHNSYERCDAPACHEETRVAVREEIVGWMKHGEGDNEPQKIMWLSGPAGAGKTAIAGSVAETCKAERILAASFFFSAFSGSTDRRSKRCLITTIASHLAEHEVLRGFREELLISIEQNPSIFHKRLKEQVECLLLGPFRRIRNDFNATNWPTSIIIDGLDEVEAQQYHDPTRGAAVANRKPDEDQLEILDALFTLAADPTFPFRIFISSRPECIIEEFFSSIAHESTVKLFLDSKYEPDADIKLFLESKFAETRRRNRISNSSWPGQPVLDRLVDMSSGQFIVPTTIMRWIQDGVPQLRLAEVLELEHLHAGDNPFATLDALYLHILKRAKNPVNDPHLVVKWISCIVSAYDSAPQPARFWMQLLENVEGELTNRLSPIISLIHVPSPENTSSHITIYHKTLIEFLYSPIRCGDLYVNETSNNSFVSERIFGILKNKGPMVSLSSPTDLFKFLRSFLWLKLLLVSDDIHGSLQFLTFLSEQSKAELASCDVAWWVSASLAGLRVDGSCLPCDGSAFDTVKANNVAWGPYEHLAQGIYWKIHQAMGVSTGIAMELFQY